VGQRAAAAGPAVRGLPGTALKSVPTPLSLELPPRADTSSGAARDVDRACQALCRVSDKLAAKRRGIEDELLQSHASVELLRSLLRVVAPPDDDDDDSQSRREEEADALAAASHGRPHFHHFIADEVLRSASEIVQRSCGSFRAAFSASLQTLTDLRRVLDGVGETLDRIHAGDALTLGLPEPALQPQPQPSSSPTSEWEGVAAAPALSPLEAVLADLDASNASLTLSVNEYAGAVARTVSSVGSARKALMLLAANLDGRLAMPPPRANQEQQPSTSTSPTGGEQQHNPQSGPPSPRSRRSSAASSVLTGASTTESAVFRYTSSVSTYRFTRAALSRTQAVLAHLWGLCPQLKESADELVGVVEGLQGHIPSLRTLCALTHGAAPDGGGETDSELARFDAFLLFGVLRSRLRAVCRDFEAWFVQMPALLNLLSAAAEAVVGEARLTIGVAGVEGRGPHAAGSGGGGGGGSVRASGTRTPPRGRFDTPAPSSPPHSVGGGSHESPGSVASASESVAFSTSSSVARLHLVPAVRPRALVRDALTKQLAALEISTQTLRSRLWSARTKLASCMDHVVSTAGKVVGSGAGGEEADKPRICVAAILSRVYGIVGGDEEDEEGDGDEEGWVGAGGEDEEGEGDSVDWGRRRAIAPNSTSAAPSGGGGGDVDGGGSILRSTLTSPGSIFAALARYLRTSTGDPSVVPAASLVCACTACERENGNLILQLEPDLALVHVVPAPRLPMGESDTSSSSSAARPAAARPAPIPLPPQYQVQSWQLAELGLSLELQRHLLLSPTILDALASLQLQDDDVPPEPVLRVVAAALLCTGLRPDAIPAAADEERRKVPWIHRPDALFGDTAVPEDVQAEAQAAVRAAAEDDDETRRAEDKKAEDGGGQTPSSSSTTVPAMTMGLKRASTRHLLLAPPHARALSSSSAASASAAAAAASVRVISLPPAATKPLSAGAAAITARPTPPPSAPAPAGEAQCQRAARDLASSIATGLTPSDLLAAFGRDAIDALVHVDPLRSVPLALAASAYDRAKRVADAEAAAAADEADTRARQSRWAVRASLMDVDVLQTPARSALAERLRRAQVERKALRLLLPRLLASCTGELTAAKERLARAHELLDDSSPASLSFLCPPLGPVHEFVATAAAVESVCRSLSATLVLDAAALLGLSSHDLEVPRDFSVQVRAKDLGDAAAKGGVGWGWGEGEEECEEDDDGGEVSQERVRFGPVIEEGDVVLTVTEGPLDAVQAYILQQQRIEDQQAEHEAQVHMLKRRAAALSFLRESGVGRGLGGAAGMVPQRQQQRLLQRAGPPPAAAGETETETETAAATSAVPTSWEDVDEGFLEVRERAAEARRIVGELIAGPARLVESRVLFLPDDQQRLPGVALPPPVPNSRPPRPDAADYSRLNASVLVPGAATPMTPAAPTSALRRAPKSSAKRHGKGHGILSPGGSRATFLLKM
jgi:hypothetical protein